MFTLMFVLFRILNSLWFDCSELLGTFPLYYFFCFWLFALLLLNVNWTGYILIGVANFLRSGGVSISYCVLVCVCVYVFWAFAVIIVSMCECVNV